MKGLYTFNHMQYAGAGLFLVMSLIGNFFLCGLFLNTLLHPQANVIFRTGMLIYLIEFLSIHSSGIAFGMRRKERVEQHAQFPPQFFTRRLYRNILQANRKITLVGFYAVFALALGYAFKNWSLPFYFL